jgi:hypothetical protein
MREEMKRAPWNVLLVSQKGFSDSEMEDGGGDHKPKLQA